MWQSIKPGNSVSSGSVMTSAPSGIRTDPSVPTSMMTLPSISKTPFSNGTAPVPSTIRFALMAVCIASLSIELRPTALGKYIGNVSSVRRDHRRRYREHHEIARLTSCVYPHLAGPRIAPCLPAPRRESSYSLGGSANSATVGSTSRSKSA